MIDDDGRHAEPGPAHGASGTGHGREAAEEALGPLDVQAWASAVLGGAAGLVVALALWVASQA